MAISVGTGMVIAAGLAGAAGIGGAALMADGTAKAQSEANRTSGLQAAAQGANSFNNYLSSRGVNLQQLVAKYPEFAAEYERIRALGEKRDFNTWLASAIQSDPSHPIWDDISNPTAGNGAQNTTLPAWAVDANGNPLQPSLMQQLVAIASGTNTPQNAPIQSLATLENARKLIESDPSVAAELEAAGVGNDGRSPAQWLVDHITQTEAAEGGGRFTDALRGSVVQAAAANPEMGPAGPAGTGNNTELDPTIQALIPQAANTATGIFNGAFLRQQLDGLKPVQDARTEQAGITADRIQELIRLSGEINQAETAGLDSVLNARTTGAGNIYDAAVSGAGTIYDATAAGAAGIRDATRGAAEAERAAAVDKLASLLGVRREAAEQIYTASVDSATGVRDARTTGANNVYGAELVTADTYAQSAEQALARSLAEETAKRRRQGFSGGSSGSDFNRARVTADYLQQGAGARALAGVNLQGRLAQAGEGFAIDTGKAGIGRATTIGQANEADATAQLQVAVELARQLGLAEVGYAGTMGGAGVGRATAVAGAGNTRAGSLATAGELDAMGRMTSNTADATRRFGLPTADGDLAAAKAKEQNAVDLLNAILNDQNRQIGAIGLPGQLAASDLALKAGLNDQKYAELDALIKRIQGFSTTPASGPQLFTPNTGSVMSGGQIGGAALSSLGTSIGALSTNQQLMEAINKWSGSGGTPAATSTNSNPYVPISGNANYLSGSSIFKGPNG